MIVVTKLFEWKTQFNKGKQGEADFIHLYRGGALQPSEIRAYDYDRREDGARIELKADQYPIESTPNFFIERWSVFEQQKPGSLWQSVSKADVFIYWFAKSGVYFEFENIQAAITQVEALIIEHNLQPVYVQNRGYRGMGYRVKRVLLKEYYKEIRCDEDTGV